MQPDARHLRVDRTARYYVLGVPSQHVRELWVVCHGYGQLANSFVRAFTPIVTPHRIVVAPEALNRYYIESAPGVHGADARVAATWMTREDRAHEIADYVSYLDALTARMQADLPHVRVTALGFSQGAATVSRWAALGQTALAHVILWGSSLAHDLELRSDLFRGAALSIVVGDSDQYVKDDRLSAERARLDAAGLHYDLHRYHGGHRIDEPTLCKLAPAGTGT